MPQYPYTVNISLFLTSMRSNKTFEEEYHPNPMTPTQNYIPTESRKEYAQKKKIEYHNKVIDIGELCSEENHATVSNIQQIIEAQKQILSLLVRTDSDSFRKNGKISESLTNKGVVARPAQSQVHPMDYSRDFVNQTREIKDQFALPAEEDRYASFHPQQFQNPSNKPKTVVIEAKELDALKQRIYELETMLLKERQVSQGLRQQLEQRDGRTNISALFDQGEVIRQQTLKLLKQEKAKKTQVMDLRKRVQELVAENTHLRRNNGRY